MFLFLPEANEADPRPSVNIALALSIALVSLLLWGVGLDSPLASTFVLQRGGDFNPLQLLGVAWVHLDLGHLVGNLLVLLALGNPLEARIGSGRYLGLFLGSVLAGSLGALWVGSHAALVGASGGVMGVALAFLLVCPLRRVRLALWIPTLFALPLGLLGVFAPGLALLTFGVATLGWLARSVLSCGEGRPPEGVVLRSLGFRSCGFAGLWLVLLSVASDLVIAGLGLGALVNVGVWAHLGGAALGALLGLWWASEVAARGQERSLLQLLGLTQTPPPPALTRARVQAPFPESAPRPARRPSAGPLAARRPSFRPRLLEGGAAREARPTTGLLLRRPPAPPREGGAPRRRGRPTSGPLLRRRAARPDSFERWVAERRRGG